MLKKCDEECYHNGRWFLLRLNVEVTDMIGAAIAKAKIRKGFASFGGRNLDKFLDNFADNAAIIYPHNLAAGGEIRGKEAIREWYRKDWEQFPEETFKVETVCVEDMFAVGATNVFTVEWSVVGKNKEHVEFSNRGISVISLVKGKVAQMRVFIFDMDLAKRVWGD
jgi:ketosteroid isomerase-like protein